MTRAADIDEILDALMKLSPGFVWEVGGQATGPAITLAPEQDDHAG